MKTVIIPKVSIVMLTYNAKTSLDNILDKAILSALNQTYPNIEVVIVDNNSTDGTADYVKKMFNDKVKIIKFSKNYGWCLGNNLAIKYIDKNSKYVLFMNSDVILAKNYVEELVKVAESDVRIAALQGLEKHPNYEEVAKVGGCLGRGAYIVDINVLVKQNRRQRCFEIPYVSGAAMLIRKDAFEKIGGFSADFFMYYDEPDLFLRLRSLGYKSVTCLNTYYLHYVGYTVTRLQQLSLVPIYFMRRNRFRIVIRYFYGKFFLYAMLFNLIALILHILKDKAVVRRTSLRILPTVLKNLKRDLMIREAYVKYVRAKHVLEAFLCLA